MRSAPRRIRAPLIQQQHSTRHFSRENSKRDRFIDKAKMIGEPTVVNAFNCEVTCTEFETRKIPGGREAKPPRCDEGNIVLVEGNIGVGKTTLCRELSDRLKYKMFCEPATENPYLAKFYSNPKKYALQLQLWIFNQRCHTYVDAMEHVSRTGIQYWYVGFILFIWNHQLRSA